jgi:single-strand DNA-binding protein
MFNKVILMGNLTRDPEMRATQNGTALCKFSIAVNRRFSKQNETDFFNVTAWGQTAEFVGKWFSKGRMILVEGRIENDNYTDNNGVKHYSMNIIAENVSFCGSKSDNGGNGYQNGGGYGNNGGYNGGGYQNNGGYGNNGGGFQNNGGYGNNGGGYGNGGYGNNGGGFQNNGGGYGNGGYGNNSGGYPSDGYNDGGFQMPQPPAPQQSAPSQQSQQFQPNPPSDEKKSVELGNISDFEEIISDGDVPF